MLVCRHWSCTALEKVRLSQVLDQFHRDPSQPQPASGNSTQRSWRIVFIPRLRELTIEDEVGAVSSFLSFLHVPPDVYVSLHGEVLSQDSPGWLVPLLPPNRHQTLPVLDTLTFRIDHRWTTHDVSAYSQGGRRWALRIFVKDSSRQNLVPPWRVLDELVRVFSSASLKTLTVSSDTLDHLDECEWSQLFAGFRTLESVELYGEGLRTTTLFDALAKSQPGERHEHDARVVCPKMREIIVDGPYWTDDATECVLECVRGRVRGAARGPWRNWI